MRVSLAHVFNLAALVALAGTASMQGAQQGTFHLTAPTHWGHAVLPAGDYTLQLPAPSLGRMGFRVEGEGKTVMEFPLATDTTQKYSESSYLTVSEIDGTYFIRGFSSGATGKTFTFATPKPTHREQMANGRDNSFALSVR